MNTQSLIRAIEQAKIALCQGDPKTGVMSPEAVSAFHELADLKFRILRENPTCEHLTVRHVEDAFGQLCGKKCEPGEYLCAEHKEN